MIYTTPQSSKFGEILVVVSFFSVLYLQAGNWFIRKVFRLHNKLCIYFSLTLTCFSIEPYGGNHTKEGICLRKTKTMALCTQRLLS